jgi:hypothetical protein
MERELKIKKRSIGTVRPDRRKKVDVSDPKASSVVRRGRREERTNQIVYLESYFIYLPCVCTRWEGASPIK